MSTRAKILAATAAILFVCLVVWVVRTTPDTPPPMEKFDPPTIMEYEGNTITEEKDGVVIWELTCQKMRVDSITQNMELTGVTGKFYQRDQNKTWELTAGRGLYYKTDNIIFVEDDVAITNNEGAKLTCEMLEWFAAEQKLTATNKVIVLNGDGATLSSDKVDWFAAEDKIIATGNVKISKDDMRGFGDMAYSSDNFKRFGLIGHAKVLKGVKDDAQGNSLLPPLTQQNGTRKLPPIFPERDGDKN